MIRPFSQRLASLMDSPFLKGSFIYLSGSILNSALPLLVLPVLTRYLTPTDFGLVATATVLTQILSVFIGLNAYGLVSRSHFDDDPDNLAAGGRDFWPAYKALFVDAGGRVIDNANGSISHSEVRHGAAAPAPVRHVELRNTLHVDERSSGVVARHPL